MSSASENKGLVRRFFEEIDAGNAAAMDELVDEHYLDHRPPPFQGLPPGREGLKRVIEIFLRSTPGTHEVVDQIASGDLVFTRIRVGGRLGVPTTGVMATAVHRVRDGVLVEHLSDLEASTLLRQLGVQAAVS
jgi:predicted SnoaL-like aldol condensation-catalyzing enzyme